MRLIDRVKRREEANVKCEFLEGEEHEKLMRKCSKSNVLKEMWCEGGCSVQRKHRRVGIMCYNNL